MIINVNTPPVTPTITGIVTASLELSALEEPVVIDMLPTILMLCHVQTSNKYTRFKLYTKHSLYSVIHSIAINMM